MLAVAVIAAAEDWERAPRLRPSDRAALAWARRWSSAVRVVVPEGDESARRHAAGLPVSFRLDDAAVRDAGLVVVGSGGLDVFGDAAVAAAADLLEAEVVFGGLAMKAVDPAGDWVVECDAGRGGRDRLTLRGPLVVVLDDAVEPPEYVSRRRLRADSTSASGPIQPRAAFEWRPAQPRPPRADRRSTAVSAEERTSAVFGIREASADRRASPVIRDEPAACARVLVRWLAHHGFVRPGGPADDGLPPAGAEAPVRSEASAPGGQPGAAPAEFPATRAFRCPRSVRHDDRTRVARRPRPLGEPSSAAAPPGFVSRRPRRLGAAVVDRRTPIPCSSTRSQEGHARISDA